MKLYGRTFRGNKIVSAMVLRGVVMGRTAPTKTHPNGRTFIIAARDLDKHTFTSTGKALSAA